MTTEKRVRRGRTLVMCACVLSAAGVMGALKFRGAFMPTVEVGNRGWRPPVPERLKAAERPDSSSSNEEPCGVP